MSYLNTVAQSRRTAYQKSIDSIWILTRTLIKVRYQSAWFGMVWSILNPLLSAATYYLIFTYVIRLRIENYTMVLLLGIFPWMFFSNAITQGMMALLGNSQLLKKTKIKLHWLVIASINFNFFNYLVAMVALVGYLLIMHFSPLQMLQVLIWFPLMTGLFYVFALGLAMIMAPLVVFFRDLEFIVPVALQLFFYFTPILYTYDLVPAEFRIFFDFNPVGHFIEGLRSLLLFQTVSITQMGMMAVVAAAFYGVGWLVMNRTRSFILDNM